MQLVESTKQLVAREILRLLAPHPGPGLHVEAFVNGREQGYSVTNFVHKASFAVDRSSDTIVVQFGTAGDFSMQGNVLRDSRVFGKREYFDTPAEAAENIAVFFKMRPSSIEAEDPETGNTVEIRMDLQSSYLP